MEKFIEQISRPQRALELRPKELLESVGAKAGMVCVDLGCGTGMFAIPMADIVGPSGKVIAIDKRREVLDILSSHSTTVTTAQEDIQRTSIAGHSIDLVLISSVLHATVSPLKVLQEARRLLKPTGILVIVELTENADLGFKTGKISRSRIKSLVTTARFTYELRPWSANHEITIGAPAVTGTLNNNAYHSP
jgi:ubiquinone/menaquinone biosynthesis C-methylase UbiE